jgi:hypothetical protein
VVPRGAAAAPFPLLWKYNFIEVKKVTSVAGVASLPLNAAGLPCVVE